MPRCLIGLVVDDNRVSLWQAEALMSIAETADFLVLNCVNTPRVKRRLVRHGAYYALNLLSLRSKLTRSVPIPSDLTIRETITFEPVADKNWQRLPEGIIDRLNQEKPDCIIKFGMGLLRVPKRLSCPILSYHHGDPRRFRGRPAGFYEIYFGEACVGQIIQVLSNRLDAGKVVAFAETRAYEHSYRKTMIESFSRSPLLLRDALRNCLAGRTLPMEAIGNNYTLPANATVFRFGCRLGLGKLRRLRYGALIEKRWQTALAPAPAHLSIAALAENFPPKPSWTAVSDTPKYRFIADPFPHPTSGIIAEGLRRTDNCGEIVHIEHDRTTVLCSGKGHFSYPGTVSYRGESFIVPEMSEWAAPTIYKLAENAAHPIAELAVQGEPRLVDPTLYTTEETVFLFANKLSEGMGVLRLWQADNLFARFEEHPASPIRISPAGARMAGAILEAGQRFRLGQDCSREYGNGILFFSIERLTRAEYAERQQSRLSFKHLKGPHTFNLTHGRLLFDFYEERVNPLAGINRLRRIAFAGF